jgi:hypothetical protein
MKVPSKRNRIPPALGFHSQSRSEVEIHYGDDYGLSISTASGKDEAIFIKSLLTHDHGSLYIPAAAAPPPDYVTARFIGKVALEILAYRCLDIPGWNDEIVHKPELDELRNYVRRGHPDFVWPINIRRIYPVNFLFTEENSPSFEVLHEWDILSIPSTVSGQGSEFYVVIAILGMEYTVNLGGPELNGFHRWLKENSERSYLYSEK